MTGGGFGGCAVALMPLGKVESVRLAVENNYRSPGGKSARFTSAMPQPERESYSEPTLQRGAHSQFGMPLLISMAPESILDEHGFDRYHQFKP